MPERRDIPSELQALLHVDFLWWREKDKGAFGSLQDGPMRDLIEIDPLVRHSTNNRRTAIQAGGNCGMYSTYLSTLFTTVYTFEPVLANFECLQLNSQQTNNVKPYNLALGKDVQYCTMSVENQVNVGTYKVQNTTKAKSFAEQVSMTTIDNYNLTNVDLIMLDVEGYEPNVLYGARDTIQWSRPTVIMEDQKHKGGRMLQEMDYTILGKVHSDTVWVPTERYETLVR